MCFSAPVSFATSAGLAMLGGVSVRAARKSADKRQMLIAVTPIFFSIQQAFEGWQWLAVQSGAMSALAGYGFLFFAFLLWPVYVPASVAVLEGRARPVLRLFIATGVIVSAALFVLLLRAPFDIAVAGHSLSYPFFVLRPLLTSLYILAVCGSLFASKNAAFRRIGVLLFVSAALAIIISRETFVSVWCFFAALISFFAYAYLRKRSVSRESYS